MANNDRVTKEPHISWIADNKSDNKPLATKATNGEIGWSNKNQTRNLLSRDAFNTPGWRDKIVIPPGMATLNYDTSLFVVLDDITAEEYPTDSYVPLGRNIRIVLKDQSYEYGCYATITNGAVSSTPFLKNFIGSTDPDNTVDTVNSTTVMVVGNIQVTGIAKKRSKIFIGADTSGIISATLEVTSWGNKGHQTTTMELAPGLGDPNELEFYAGDQVKFTIKVDSPYHWCNFRYNYGTNTTMFPVNKSEVVYSSNGGTYTALMTEQPLYLAMGGIRPISFYLYQEGSNTFTNTKARVVSVNTNLNLYTTASQPSPGTDITYGKNGTAGNHVALYPGMKISIYCSNSSLIATGAAISYKSLTPMPVLPDQYSGTDNLEIEIANASQENGLMCIGLRYIKPRMRGNIAYPGSNENQDNISFKDMLDNAYNGHDETTGQVFFDFGQPYFTNFVHRVTPLPEDQYKGMKYVSETQALKLDLVRDHPFSWEIENHTNFSKSNYSQSFGGDHMPNEVQFVAEYITLGPFAVNYWYAYIIGTEKDTASNGDQIFRIYFIGDYTDLYVPGPTSDWTIPGTEYKLTLDQLEATWDNPAWKSKVNWKITPYFVAITRSA